MLEIEPSGCPQLDECLQLARQQLKLAGYNLLARSRLLGVPGAPIRVYFRAIRLWGRRKDQAAQAKLRPYQVEAQQALYDHRPPENWRGEWDHLSLAAAVENLALNHEPVESPDLTLATV